MLGIEAMIKTLSKKRLIILLIIGVLLHVECKSTDEFNDKFQPILLDMAEVVNNIDGRDDLIAKFIYEASIAINHLQRDILAQGIDIELKAMQKVQGIKQKISNELRKLQLNTDMMALSMQDAIKQESIWLSHRVGKKTLDIIDNVERVVFALRKSKLLAPCVSEPKKCVLRPSMIGVSNKQSSVVLPEQSASLLRQCAYPIGVDVSPQQCSKIVADTACSKMIPDKSVSLLRQCTYPASVMLPRSDITEAIINNGEYVNAAGSIVLDQSKLFCSAPLKRSVTSEWKNKISRDFYQNVSFLRDIIVSAESPQESRDFSNRFAEQSFWFDNTLRSTHFVYDPSYTSIVQKCSRLEDIVSAQKKAEAFLMKAINPLGLSRIESQKMRLSLLYNLYSLLPDGVSLPNQSWLPVGLTEQRIKEEVQKIVYSLQPTQGVLCEPSRYQMIPTVLSGLSHLEIESLMKPVEPIASIGHEALVASVNTPHVPVISTKEFEDLMQPVVVTPSISSAQVPVPAVSENVSLNKEIESLLKPVTLKGEEDLTKIVQATPAAAISTKEFEALMKPVGVHETVTQKEIDAKPAALVMKSPLEEVRDLLRDNRRYFEEVKEVTKKRERQAGEFLNKAIQAQEIEKLELEVQMKKTNNSLEEIRIAQQELLGIQPEEKEKPVEKEKLVAKEKLVEKEKEKPLLLHESVAVIDAPSVLDPVEKKSCSLINNSIENKSCSLLVDPNNEALNRVRYEKQLTVDQLQKELINKQDLQVKIEILNKKNIDLQILLKSAEAATDHVKQQTMDLVRQRTQEVRDELTAIMTARLQGRDHEVSDQIAVVKKYQVHVEAQEKKNLQLESDLRSNNQQVMSLEKRVLDSDQKVNQLSSSLQGVTKENTHLGDMLKSVNEEKNYLRGSLQVVQQQADQFKQEAIINKNLYVEAGAKSILIEESSKKSIDYLARERALLAKERDMMAQLLDRERKETEQKILALKNQLTERSTLFTPQNAISVNNGLRAGNDA